MLMLNPMGFQGCLEKHTWGMTALSTFLILSSEEPAQTMERGVGVGEAEQKNKTKPKQLFLLCCRILGSCR